MKWQAIVVGAPVHAISNGGECHWVTIDGFQVQGARYDGIKMSGDHNVVRNCWVHNNQAMGIAMHARRGGVIENNLIEFNGSHIQFDHGVYTDGEELTVRGNVVLHNASFGLHLYPSIKNSIIENNVVHGQVKRRGIIASCPPGGGQNRIVQNTVVDDAPLTIWNGEDLTLTVEVGWSMLQEKDLTYLNLFGNAGAALLNPTQIHKEMHGHLVNVTPQIPAKDYMRASWRMLVDLWIESLVRRTPLPIDATEVLTVSRLADAFYRSQSTRGEVPLTSEEP